MNFACFSPSSANLYGTAIYLTSDGEKVEVTCVGSEEYLQNNYNWEDKIMLGPVKEYVCQGRLGELDFDIDDFHEDDCEYNELF